MSDDTSNKAQVDLLQFARDYAAKNVDLYKTLEITTETADKDIHRAWKRQNLKYHPDKTRDAFDPVIYELVGRAKDILTNTEARKAYDEARRAKEKRVAEAEAMSKERRRYKDELEQAEAIARKKQEEKVEKRREMEREQARMMAEAEEAERLEAEAERRDREKNKKDIQGLDDKEAEIMKKLMEKKAKREARKKEEDESGKRKKTKKKTGSSYLYSTDPILSYEEKVEGVLGKLREAQKKRDAVASAKA